jgi:hypothetical protein
MGPRDPSWVEFSLMPLSFQWSVCLAIGSSLFWVSLCVSLRCGCLPVVDGHVSEDAHEGLVALHLQLRQLGEQIEVVLPLFRHTRNAGEQGSANQVSCIRSRQVADTENPGLSTRKRRCPTQLHPMSLLLVWRTSISVGLTRSCSDTVPHSTASLAYRRAVSAGAVALPVVTDTSHGNTVREEAWNQQGHGTRSRQHSRVRPPTLAQASKAPPPLRSSIHPLCSYLWPK